MSINALSSSAPLSKPNNYKFGGKEEQTEFDFNIYDFEARMYDPALGRFNSVDPKADIREWVSSYNYVQNNPLVRIDPTGETDFKFDKKTGEVTQVGEANDEPDKIVKTYKSGKKKGQVKYYKRGKKKGQAKAAIGGIEKGILKDGQNFKTDDQVIEVGGDGQPSVEGMENFLVQFSNHIGKEVAGFHLSPTDAKNITHTYIGAYQNNTYKQSRAGYKLSRINPELNKLVAPRIAWHTHPTGGNISSRDSNRPSKGDLDFRDGIQQNPRSKITIFRILAGDKRINYTRWGRFSN